MRKIFSILFALALVLSLSLMITTPVAAAVINVNSGMTTAQINAAIAGAGSGNTVQFANGIYNLSAPLVVGVGGVILQGDTTTPSNVVINAPTGATDMDCFQVKADGVTIQGFEIQGAHFPSPCPWTNGWQNAGIMVGNDGNAHGRTLMNDPATYDGLSVTVTHNEITDCEYGMFLYEVHDSTITYNKITNAAHGMSWGGDAIHLYFESGTEYITGNDVSHNIMDNVRNGVMFNSGTNVITLDFSGNNVEGNVMTNVWNTGIVFQAGSGTADSPITIRDNIIDTSTGAKSGDEQNENGLITVYTDYTEIINNTVTNSYHHGIWIDGSHHTVTGNTVTNNSKDGIHVGHYKAIEPVYGPFGDLTRVDITITNNTLEDNTYGVWAVDCDATVDARYNWWGANDGPGPVGPGSGDGVSANVLFVPWACQPTTGGLAYLTPSAGVLDDLAPVPPPPGAPVTLPYGMFSFTVTGITGQVTVTVELPGAVPVGTKWWKYQNGSWYWLPISSDDGDNIITVTLTDGGSGDADGAANGEITDPGGPGNPAVGWETYPISKVRVLLPWIALFATIAAGLSLLVLRRRRAQS